MTSENTTYQAIFMLYDSITQLKPNIFFELPRIEKHLKEVAMNESTFPFWGEGKGVNILKFFFILFYKIRSSPLRSD